jgi:hypothetical protein
MVTSNAAYRVREKTSQNNSNCGTHPHQRPPLATLFPCASSLLRLHATPPFSLLFFSFIAMYTSFVCVGLSVCLPLSVSVGSLP